MIARHLRLLMFVAMMASVLAGPGIAASAVSSQPLGDTADPSSAARFYSKLEAEGRFSDLYDFMHPDAQAIIPEAAVVGWYQDNFAPLGPGVITVTGVQMVPWSWGVTGMLYPDTAEVSFQQPFANAPTANEVVRLVEHDGQWRWFFGRSREFVDEQIANYASVANLPESSCDGAAEWWAETNPRIGATHYGAFTLLNVWNGGFTDEQLLREYEFGFATLHDEQEQSVPPSSATALHDDFLAALSLYESASGNLAAVASGNMNPLAETAALATAAEALDSGEFALLGLEGRINVFLATCQPVVVFVPTLGGDTPPAPVLPGEPEPEGYFPVDCDRFETRLDAQRFYDAAGPNDPHGLDADGDGIACAPGE